MFISTLPVTVEQFWVAIHEDSKYKISVLPVNRQEIGTELEGFGRQPPNSSVYRKAYQKKILSNQKNLPFYLIVANFLIDKCNLR